MIGSPNIIKKLEELFKEMFVQDVGRIKIIDGKTIPIEKK